jgi:SHS2 domain-containing protein
MDRTEPWEPSSEDEIRPGVRELDHTADLGIEIEGATREAVFRRAAQGMFALMREEGEGGLSAAETGSADTRVLEEHHLALRARTVDTLLARWLQELLYLYDSHRLVPTRFEFESLSDTHLVARVGLHRSEEAPARELKGVTYHDLEVLPVGDEWRARVIFDV